MIADIIRASQTQVHAEAKLEKVGSDISAGLSELVILEIMNFLWDRNIVELDQTRLGGPQCVIEPRLPYTCRPYLRSADYRDRTHHYQRRGPPGWPAESA